VRKNEEVELRIDSLAFGGAGVARLDGYVVFVRRGLPGDTVRARVTKVKPAYAEAFCTDVLAPGRDRVEPSCSHFGRCGGCKLQDLAYPAQAREKETQVRDALARLAGLADLPLEPIVPAVEAYGYRNKVEFSFARTEGGPALGFHRAGRWDEVLEIERCWLVSDAVNDVRRTVQRWARAEGLPAYEQRGHDGYLRHLVVREGRRTGQVLVLLVTSPGALPGRSRLVDALRTLPQVRSVHWAVNDRPAEVTSLPTEVLWGDEAIEEEMLGLRFRIRPGAFLQTNTLMAERLYEVACEYAGLTGVETVYDLYAGTGTIGLVMARSALTVWGVELSEESVACAIENAALNGIANAAYFAGDVAASLEELLPRSGRPDVVVVDPPRAGLSGKALQRVAGVGADRIVYVSCNPTTLAGNARQLVGELGYRLARARPLDMFPHTPHVETVALFTRA
jgi:23S rRNA (uracil1939-C5)-methyltransferase